MEKFLRFSYPYTAATQTPSKQTATQLKGRPKDQEVAEAAAVSQRHLERVFFEVCGLSPMAYLLELRLRHASLLLRGTSKTVAEIAGECGFEDPSYFARVFKRKYGAPPNQCRNAKAL